MFVLVQVLERLGDGPVQQRHLDGAVGAGLGAFQSVLEFQRSPRRPRRRRRGRRRARRLGLAPAAISLIKFGLAAADLRREAPRRLRGHGVGLLRRRSHPS